MKNGLSWGLFNLAVILGTAIIVPLHPVEAATNSRGTTVRSDILRNDPGEVVVRHTRFNWGQFGSTAVVTTVAYGSLEAAQQAARSLAASACSQQWRMRYVLLTGNLFGASASVQDCNSMQPSSYCFALPEGSTATAAIPSSARCYKARR